MRRVGLGLLRVATVALVAVVIGPAGIAMAAPTVTLNSPESPSNNTTPSFNGTASEFLKRVVVHIKKAGASLDVSSAEATGTGGGWTSSEASPELLEGEYEAEAEQEATLGFPGKSNTVTFTVITKPPTVTLNAPASPSNNTRPSFTGTASDTTPVTVKIYTGPEVKGSSISMAEAATGGVWSSGNASPALPDGQYTAIASQPSKFFGNGLGKSNTVTFTVVTKPPTVTLNPPALRSNITTPSFVGTATDTTPVIVRIYNAATSVEVSKAEAPGTGGNWSSGAATPALPEGNYKAEATQPSSIFGNGEGRSAPAFFTVETAAPRVTLNPPASPSNITTPSFTGTASDTTTVTVQIYKGATATGSVVSTATAPGTGVNWASGNASPALKNGQYTATATQTSSLKGNAAGTSAPVTFVVDTNAPTVTLNSPPSRSNNTTPSFKGTATDTSPVVVNIYAGATATGSPVSTATATGTGGSWTSGNASPALANGQYTATATQESKLQNHPGASAPVMFTVDTSPPHVTLTSPANGSSTSSGSQLVQGSAGTEPGDLPSVAAQLFSGAAIVGGQAPLQSISVEGSGGTWSATFGGLGPGTYTARAVQSDDVGNTGVSNTTTFVVTGAAGAAAHPPPAASFTWFPAAPYTGEPVSLASGSTDAASPITGFAWDLAGKGTFAPGAAVISTSFFTPGNHVVQLRVTDASGLSSVAAETIPVTGPPLTLMQPFPIVRIASTDTASGIMLNLLRVQAPAGARIAVGCKGRGCPVKSQSRVAVASRTGVAHKVGVATVEFRRFERSLRAGVSLEIRISKRGQIGKYTRFVVRRGKLPVRVDTCLGPAGVKPLACPSS
jgi:hypothetical protein